MIALSNASFFLTATTSHYFHNFIWKEISFKVKFLMYQVVAGYDHDERYQRVYGMNDHKDYNNKNKQVDYGRKYFIVSNEYRVLYIYFICNLQIIAIYHESFVHIIYT